MNPSDQTQPNIPQGPDPNNPVQVNNPLSVMEGGEQNICQIQRHPIGLFGMYASSGLLLIVVAVLAFLVAPHYITSMSSSKVTAIGAVVFIVIAAFTLLFVFIANKVYWGNSWILTTDSLTQVLQRTLFDKQSSQLSLGNLEDVTAQQDGILAHMFNFGVLRVETAGERSKFMFAFCPNPTAYAQQILRAREAFEQRHSGPDEQPLYRSEGSYQTQINDQPYMPPQPPQPTQPQSPYEPPQPPTFTPPPDPTGGTNIDTE